MLKRIGLMLAVAALVTPGYQEAAKYRFENGTGGLVHFTVNFKGGRRDTLAVLPDGTVWWNGAPRAFGEAGKKWEYNLVFYAITDFGGNEVRAEKDSPNPYNSTRARYHGIITLKKNNSVLFAQPGTWGKGPDFAGAFRAYAHPHGLAF